MSAVEAPIKIKMLPRILVIDNCISSNRDESMAKGGGGRIHSLGEMITRNLHRVKTQCSK